LIIKILNLKPLFINSKHIQNKMGNLFANVFGKLFSSNKTFNILILGLANAGKTTLLYQM